MGNPAGAAGLAHDGSRNMIGIETFVPHMKALHLGVLSLWIAGLIALPTMLARHDRAIVQSEFSAIRRATHFGFVWFVTPAAVIAIASGTALVFMRDIFSGWIFAKFVLVAGLVAVHAWVGHTIIAVAETEGQYEPPDAFLATFLTVILVIGVLFLVLAKPELNELPFPQWLLQPLGRPLPFDVPR